jgi:anti-anti-sigma factor
MIRFEEQQHHCQAHVEDDMTIYTAAQLKNDFSRVINDERDMEICLSNVGEIDSAGVQLLMLAKRERSRNNLPLRLSGHSAAVLDLFELYRLAPYFGDPIILGRSEGEHHV